MREVSLFSGAGGGVLGSKLLGWTKICYVEWEDYCIEVLKQRIRDGLIDDAPIWDDVRTFDGEPWRGVADVVTAGFPCFVEGTMVLTRRGYRPIESISPGDEVLTHRGRWREVKSRSVREDVPVREIRAGGVPGVVTTDEHPFWARRQRKVWDNEDRKYDIEIDDPEWVDASDLHEDDRLGRVLPPVRDDDDHPPEFWYAVGRWLADGWTVPRRLTGSGNPVEGDQGRVVICCSHDEADDLEAKLDRIPYRATRSEARTTTKFIISDNGFYEFVREVPKGAHRKTMPAEWLSLPKEKAEQLLLGYFDGDGHFEGDIRRITSTSRALALSAALLVQRVWGVSAGVVRHQTPDRTEIEGREVNQRDFYRVNIPTQNSSAVVEGDYAWTRQRKNERLGRRETVYNIAVEEDESYVADGAIVHNCQPFSIAGEKKADDDERNMWPDTARLVREIRPKFAFLENVPGLRSGKHGYFGTVLADLAEIGYDAVWDCIPACAVDAPHRRERLWILAWDSDVDDRLLRRMSVTRCTPEAVASPGEPDVADRQEGDLEADGAGEDVEERGQEARLAAGERPGAGGDGGRQTPGWLPEPDVDRVADGVANRVDRLKAIGNGQVPHQMALSWEILAGRMRRLLAAEEIDDRYPRPLKDRDLDVLGFDSRQVTEASELGLETVGDVADWILDGNAMDDIPYVGGKTARDAFEVVERILPEEIPEPELTAETAFGDFMDEL